jgi:hypothetical protein
MINCSLVVTTKERNMSVDLQKSPTDMEEFLRPRAFAKKYNFALSTVQAHITTGEIAFHMFVGEAYPKSMSVKRSE